MWGEVLRGDNMQLQFYPDHYAFYWEYTFDAQSNPDLGLVIEGEFPDARFLSYNVYDDDEQTSYCEKGFSIMDVDIEPEAGCTNPYRGTSWQKGQKYTVYVLPTDAPTSISSGKKNIVWFDADVKKVCTILRYYLPTGDGVHGQVDMPTVKAINVVTGKFADAPARQLSGLRGSMELPGAAFTSSANMLFFRAPFSYAYPNGPAEYCYNRNTLETDSVMFFNFKAPSFPTSYSEFNNVDMRYWSVCIGNDQTYTPLAITDANTKIDANGFANYVVADKNSANFAAVKAIAEERGYNLFEWDGKAWNDGLMILYRNMVFADDYAHSLRQLDPVGPGVNVMENPAKYICVLGLGQWGATGRKLDSNKFIAAKGIIPIRQAQ